MKNNLVSLYLIHSFLYYELDCSLISDVEFNSICKELLENYDSITHMHKHLIDKESLRASTGYDLKYPEVVKATAIMKYMEETGINPLAEKGIGKPNTNLNDVLRLHRLNNIN